MVHYPNSAQENEICYSLQNHEPLRVSLFCCNCEINSCQLSRITPVDVGHEPVNITLDSGATASFITSNLCKKLNLDVLPNGKMARLGDGCTTMASLGEVGVHFVKNRWSLRFQAIIVKKLNSITFKPGPAQVRLKSTTSSARSATLGDTS